METFYDCYFLKASGLQLRCAGRCAWMAQCGGEALARALLVWAWGECAGWNFSEKKLQLPNIFEIKRHPRRQPGESVSMSPVIANNACFETGKKSVGGKPFPKNYIFCKFPRYLK